MRKIFVLTGEPSGDKLASTVVSKLKVKNPDIEYLSVGGAHLKKLGLVSIFDLKDITYLGFTKVLFNIFGKRFKIKRLQKTNNTSCPRNFKVQYFQDEGYGFRIMSS